MSWITFIWAAGAGACLTLALIYFVVWWKDRAARANLAFSVMAIAVAAFAALKLAVMRAKTYSRVMQRFTAPAGLVVFQISAEVASQPSKKSFFAFNCERRDHCR